MKGTLLKGIGGFYYALGEDNLEYTLHAQSKIRRVKLKPLVGDKIEFEAGENGEEGWLKAIYPRTNELVRPPVSNIDALVITLSAGVPEADKILADRLITVAKQKHIQPILAINKCDTAPEIAEQIAQEYSGAGIEVYKLSAVNGDGINELRLALKGKIHAFAGQSGVGKSSIINALYGMEMETGDISRKIERGRHTTRMCSLVPVNEGAVLDTPGFSLIEDELIDPEKLQEYYGEFEPYRNKCRFMPCCHASEPDCEVKRALGEGKIDTNRYQRYILLLNELRERWSKRYD